MTRWKDLNRQIVKCDLSPRLRDYCHAIAAVKRRAYRDCDYWAKPVPNFGDPAARLLIVGLAPAAHGANRTGRMFTGDRSGNWLFHALHKVGLANQPDSSSPDDGLRLLNCAITAVCHCAPPENRPTGEETEHCRRWLEATIDLLSVRVFLALGQIAFKAMVNEAAVRGWHEGRRPKFAHEALVELTGDRWLLGSYHPSQQNTFTGRLTEPMFDRVFRTAGRLLEQAARCPE